MKKLLLSLILLGSLNSFAQGSCAAAINITTNGTIVAPAVTGTFSNSCYTHTTTDGGGAINGIWYKYTPAANGEITIDANLPVNIAPNSVDTKVSIFTGDCFALTCYDVNDDNATNFLSTITFPVVGGTTYYIQWDNFWDGNGFEFTFNYTANTCIKPYYINAVTNLTTTSATLNWDASVSAPSGYEVEYGLTGFTQGTGTVATTSTNSIALSGLNASVIYDYYIRSVCSVSSQSAWSAVNNLVLAKVCPYASGFDTTAQLQGWTTAGNGAYGLGTTAANAQSPTQYWIMNTNTATTSNNWLFSPPFNLQAGEQVTVSFWVRCASARSLRLTVGNLNSTAAQTTQIWANTALLATTYAQQTAPAWTAPTAGIYYFAFNDISAATAAAATLRIDTTNFTSVLGTNDFLSSKFSVFPNPVNNVINFSNDQNAIVSTVELADLNGRVIKTEKVNATEGQVSVSDLATGMYMMKITTDQGVAVKKIVKQ
ncbi:T9SS type A sorting domain-containing protein [Flavobacterium sangjuense]|uniref:Fibronectin type-III domain-containing protein n=1 Tax=Flavobacterium sangjuense TaxID=2518177 RepID=A0A4P7PW35_9FLAO|nr:T9SS type A sorting domain-containing protein [Flavobacterium sangjuense]QBZ98610.1 hypothetical protein GS03_02119 [Flavobacterium sangjuense]